MTQPKGIPGSKGWRRRYSCVFRILKDRAFSPWWAEWKRSKENKRMAHRVARARERELVRAERKEASGN